MKKDETLTEREKECLVAIFKLRGFNITFFDDHIEFEREGVITVKSVREVVASIRLFQ